MGGKCPPAPPPGYATAPFDICIVHQETRPITHPVTKEKMNMPVNAHYQVTNECIQRNDPKFIPS